MKIVYEIEVPKDQQAIIDDTPGAYRVVLEGPCICIVYGRYGRRWQANVSCRWLVMHLLRQLENTQRERPEAGQCARAIRRVWGHAP